MVNRHFFYAAIVSFVAHIAAGAFILAAARAPVTVPFGETPRIEVSLIAGLGGKSQKDSPAPVRTSPVSANENKVLKSFEKRMEPDFEPKPAVVVLASLNSVRDLAVLNAGGAQVAAPSHPERQGERSALKSETIRSSDRLETTETSTAERLVMPSYREHPQPEYPRLARFRGQEGIVLLAAEVRRDGTVGQLRVEKSSGYALLDQSALNSVRKWKFSLGKKMGAPATIWVDIPIRFALQDES
jgi:TonB family protein